MRFVASRLPSAEVDDVVQETLAEALASARTPDSIEQIRGWVHGIARHKIADYYRSHQRSGRMPEDEERLEAAPEAHSLDARDLLKWAEQQTEHDPSQLATLEWMLREGDGDRLQEIAQDARVPAARVRQRVSRLRRALRSRWTAELSAAAGVIALALLVWWWNKRPTEPPIVHEKPTPELDRGRDLREHALRDCEAADWDRCIAGLDAAKRLDPAGDRSTRVERTRAAAEAALRERNATHDSVPALSAEPPPVQSAPVPSHSAPAPTSTEAVPQNAPLKRKSVHYSSKPASTESSIDESWPSQQAPAKSSK